MKIVDLQYMDAVYCHENNVSSELKRLHYPQKYVKLLKDDEVLDLEIDSLDDKNIYLRIKPPSPYYAGEKWCG